MYWAIIRLKFAVVVPVLTNENTSTGSPAKTLSMLEPASTWVPDEFST